MFFFSLFLKKIFIILDFFIIIPNIISFNISNFGFNDFYINLLLIFNFVNYYKINKIENLDFNYNFN